MMKEEKYQKLNQYLNEYFMYLEQSDPVYLENLGYISFISDKVISDLKGKYEIKIKENNLSWKQVYQLAREVLSSINEKYLPLYDDILDSGILNFDYENNYYNSNYTFIYRNNEKHPEINIVRKYNYEDVSTLIHEFFHYLNDNDICSYNRNFLTEFISIYFELISNKYLIDKYNISDEDVSAKIRVLSLLSQASTYSEYGLILYMYDNLGNISERTKDDLEKYFQIQDNYFDKECTELENNLSKSKTVNSFFKTSYQYIIGTVLAYYASENCKVEDIVKLNDLINTPEYANMSVCEILNKIGIENNYLDESIKIMKKTLNNK